MNKQFFVAILIAASSVAASPVFANSGYGPAPRYNPIDGAPASQRGQSVATIQAENVRSNGASKSYGGVGETRSEAGHRVATGVAPSLYARH
jgi:hypothetical protein